MSEILLHIMKYLQSIDSAFRNRIAERLEQNVKERKRLFEFNFILGAGEDRSTREDRQQFHKRQEEV